MAISTAVSPNAVARVVGIETKFVNLRGNNTVNLPQRVVVLGTGNAASVYSLDKQRVFSASEAGRLYGYGSLIHLAVKELLPENGAGLGDIPVTVYPVEAPALSGTASGGLSVIDLDYDNPELYQVSVSNIFSEVFELSGQPTALEAHQLVADAINANIAMPVLAVASALEVTLTAKWPGAVGDQLVLGIVQVNDAAKASNTTLTLTDITGGSGDYDLNPALDQFGDVWETFVVNTFGPSDTNSYAAALGAFGDGRWGALTRKPFVALTGFIGTFAEAQAQAAGVDNFNRAHSYIPAPGSDNLPAVVAAAAVAKIAVLANINPPYDYGSQRLTSLTQGKDSDQWDAVVRDAAVKFGFSTTVVKDGTINLSDVVTGYIGDGTGAELNPAYRYVVDIVKVMNVLFNLDLIFASADWNGAPLLPNNQATVNRSAKKPRAAVAAVATLIDSLALEAIISNPEEAKRSIVAEIDSNNPKRLNICVTIQLAGNTNIISIDFKFGFFFGTQATGQERLVAGSVATAAPPVVPGV